MDDDNDAGMHSEWRSVIVYQNIRMTRDLRDTLSPGPDISRLSCLNIAPKVVQLPNLASQPSLNTKPENLASDLSAWAGGWSWLFKI